MKWTQWLTNDRSPDVFDFLITILDTDDVEVLQSAEIVYRELRVRSLSVLLDDRRLAAGEAVSAPVRPRVRVEIEIGGKGLSEEGGVRLIESSSGRSQWVNLEDIVEKSEELLKCKHATLN